MTEPTEPTGTTVPPVPTEESAPAKETAPTTSAFQFRPRKVRYVAAAIAVAFIAVFTVVAFLLRSEWTGAYFQTSDQVAMVGIGLMLAFGVLTFTRSRVRADESGIEVRNLIGTRRYEWKQVEHVSFPDGASWARLELPDDEYATIMAIPAIDGERSVVAMRELRRLKAKADAETAAAE